MKMTSEEGEKFNIDLNAATKRAAAALAEILGCDVELNLDQIHAFDQSSFQDYIRQAISETGTVVQIRFSGGVLGSVNFILPGANEQAMLEILSAQEPGLAHDPDAQTAVILEIANIVLNMYAGTVVNQMGVNVTYEIPRIISRKENVGLIAEPELDQMREQKIQILISRMSISGHEITIFILFKFFLT